jgi:hypothetical protein
MYGEYATKSQPTVDPTADTTPTAKTSVAQPDVIGSTPSNETNNNPSAKNQLANAMAKSIADPEANTPPGYMSSTMQDAGIPSYSNQDAQNNEPSIQAKTTDMANNDATDNEPSISAKTTAMTNDASDDPSDAPSGQVASAPAAPQGDPGASGTAVGGQNDGGDNAGNAGNDGGDGGDGNGGHDGDGGDGGGGEKRGGFVNHALRKARASGGDTSEAQNAMAALMDSLRQKQMQGQSKFIASATNSDNPVRRTLPESVTQGTGNNSGPRSLPTAQPPRMAQDNAMTAAQGMINAGQSGQGLGDTVSDMMYGSGPKPSAQATAKPSTTPNTQRAAPAAQPTSGGDRDSILTGLLGNISNKLESGGNYGALGPMTKSGDRAYGKYQVMGSNIPSWTATWYGKSLSPQDFLKNQDAQEAVAKGQIGSYLDKYGNPQDAASMWFTGRPAAQGANLHDQLGSSGANYVAKATQGLPTMSQAQTEAAQPAQSDSQWTHDIPIENNHFIRNGIVYDGATNQPLTDAQINQSLPKTSGNQDTSTWYKGNYGPKGTNGPTALNDQDPNLDNVTPINSKKGGYIKRAPGGSAVNLANAPSPKIQLLNKLNSSIPAKRGGTIVDKALALTRRR